MQGNATNLLNKALNNLKEAKAIGEEALAFANIEIEKEATDEEKEAVFNLQKVLNKAVKNNDFETIKNIIKNGGKI